MTTTSSRSELDVLRLAAGGGEDGQRGDQPRASNPRQADERSCLLLRGRSSGGARRHTPAPAASRAPRARTRLGPRTEPISSTPVTIWIQYDEMDSLSSSAFWMPPSRSSARTTPAIVPRPPKIETPPSSTAVTTVSSKPMPTFAAAVELRREMTTPASAATAPESDEQRQLDPLDAQAGEERRLLVGADGVDRAPERREVQEHREQDGEDGEQDDHVRHRGPGEVPERAVGPGGREVGHRVVADDDERQAAEQRERADRHRQRRQAEAGDEQAVERAAQAAERRCRSG